MADESFSAMIRRMQDELFRRLDVESVRLRIPADSKLRLGLALTHLAYIEGYIEAAELTATFKEKR